jgi:glycerophosphoryl diester phosphodiesterase
LISSPASNCSFFSGPQPRLFAHRGASAKAPENTLKAFRLAWEDGAPYLELDLRLSADGHLVVSHDNSVARTTGRRGRVENMTFDELRQLDAGYCFTPDHGRTYPYRGRGLLIPAFEEVMEAFSRARLNVEIKRSREGIEESVANAIHRYGASERVVIAAREHDILERFRALDGGIHTSFSKDEVREFLGCVRAGDFLHYEPSGVALQVPEYFGLRRVVSPPVIEAAHHIGVEVHVWTVNEPVHIERLLGWGVDGIMTDDPARALAEVEALREGARRNMSEEG